MAHGTHGIHGREYAEIEETQGRGITIAGARPFRRWLRNARFRVFCVFRGPLLPALELVDHAERNEVFAEVEKTAIGFAVLVGERERGLLVDGTCERGASTPGFGVDPI